MCWTFPASAGNDPAFPMNIQKMLKQAQQMQAQLAQTQSALAAKVVEASAGGGKVTVIRVTEMTPTTRPKTNGPAI